MIEKQKIAETIRVIACEGRDIVIGAAKTVHVRTVQCREALDYKKAGQKKTPRQLPGRFLSAVSRGLVVVGFSHIDCLTQRCRWPSVGATTGFDLCQLKLCAVNVARNNHALAHV